MPHLLWLVGSRRRIVLLVVSLLALAVALVAHHLATTPLSQPCWFLPEGANPPLGPVVGSPTGRQGPLVMALAGDAMLGRGVSKRFRSPTFDPWAQLGSVLADVDLMMINLETTITRRKKTAAWKIYHFALQPEYLQRALADLPLPEPAVRVASVANNHILDYGVEGLRDTLRYLGDAGFASVGAGESAQRAHAPLVVTTAGIRVGVLAVGDHCGCLRMCRWIATPERPGIWYANLSGGAWQGLLQSVRHLEPAVDLTVVSLHWGPNWLDDGPALWMRSLAAALVAAGADVVHGHSAHHILPVDAIDGKQVFYSLGGFIDDYRPYPEYRADLGLIAKIRFTGDGAQSLELVPTRIKRRRVTVLPTTDPDHQQALRRAQPNSR